MKIAVLSSHTPSLRWFRMDMLKNFIAKGHTVVAVGNESETEWKAEFEKDGIEYRQADIKRNGTNPLSDIQTLRSLKKILKEEKPDKIFTYQAKTVVYGSIAANLLGITEVYPLIAGVGSVFLSDSLKARIVRSILKIEYRIALKKAPKVFFQNQDDVQLFVKHKMVEQKK